ncbi:MAG: ABC transporter ATP-binding protein/permease [Betaproteobacteria bacterium]|nr:ABC transporter ATP-binding protein/permease [Betaproteobacteria bacterium]
MTTTKAFLRDLWALARPYWFSEERRTARLLLAVVIALNLGIVYVNVEINHWQNAFFNTLQDKNQAEFLNQLIKFCWLAGAYIVMAVYGFYLRQMLQIRWRRWLTERYLNEWLDGRMYYRLQLTDRGTDNPDQRISEDLRLFADLTLTYTLDLMSTVVTLVSFIAILWALSGPLTFMLGDASINVPGYLVWVALVYAIAGTWLTHRIGKPLIKLHYDQQRFEADLRYSLVRFRENAEGVALYHGEADEKRNFVGRFREVMANWWEIMQRRKKLTGFTYSYGQVAVIFPYVVVAPRFFSGAIQLGGLMQTASAFSQVQGSLSWFVDVYARLAEWKATVDRLIGFHNAIERARAEALRNPGVAQKRDDDTGAIVLDDVRLELPNGRVLLEGANEKFVPGEAVLVMGPSGIGKSTLFRAIAGIWPFGNGRITVPGNARVLFLPQKPYLQVGSLRDVMCYPEYSGRFEDAELGQILADCGLPHLAERLDEQHNWALELSVGEQQRIAFCRALLRKPDWLMLDEATSALDAPSETQIYQLLKERLPNTTIISIGHRHTLAAFHDRKIDWWPTEESEGVQAAAA